jgi:Cation transport protein.
MLFDFRRKSNGTVVSICELLFPMAPFRQSGVVWRLWNWWRSLSPPQLFVSASCNAGFSTFTTSLEAFQSNLPLLMVVMGLIVVGGSAS